MLQPTVQYIIIGQLTVTYWTVGCIVLDSHAVECTILQIMYKNKQ
jgi:hypothetical protein